jgi:hypothetical protein
MPSFSPIDQGFAFFTIDNVQNQWKSWEINALIIIFSCYIFLIIQDYLQHLLIPYFIFSWNLLFFLLNSTFLFQLITLFIFYMINTYSMQIWAFKIKIALSSIIYFQALAIKSFFSIFFNNCQFLLMTVLS